MSKWTIDARRLPMRPNDAGYYSSGHDLPALVVDAHHADHAARIGHEVAGLGVPGVTRSIVTVSDGTAEPVTSYRWWLNGTEVTPVAVRRVNGWNGNTITWTTVETGATWLQVTRSIVSGKWGEPVSDVVDVPARLKRRRWTSPNGARWELENRFSTVLDIVNGAFDD